METNSNVQSVLLSKANFSEGDAKKWIVDHGFKLNKIDITKDYYRFRQKAPSKNGNYRMHPLGDVGLLVLEK